MFSQILNEERVQKIKTTTITGAKYGLIFTSGVLVGTICGFVLFFKIGGDPT